MYFQVWPNVKAAAQTVVRTCFHQRKERNDFLWTKTELEGPPHIRARPFAKQQFNYVVNVRILEGTASFLMKWNRGAHFYISKEKPPPGWRYAGHDGPDYTFLSTSHLDEGFEP